MKNLYTSQVTVTSGRDGSAQSSDGLLSVKLGFPKELGGAGDAVNPEQLFVAGFAACFGTSLKVVASAKGTNLGQVRIEGEGTLSLRDDGSYIVSHVKFTVHADQWGQDAAAIIAEAKRVCAYSNATRGNVEIDVVIASI